MDVFLFILVVCLITREKQFGFALKSSIDKLYLYNFIKAFFILFQKHPTE